MKTYVFLLVVLWLSAAGCSNTKASTKAMIHGTIDAVCIVAHKGADLVMAPVEDVQANSTAVVDAVKGLAK